MVKILRTLAVAALALVSTATFSQTTKVYPEDLSVVVNNIPAEKQVANVEVTMNENGTIDFNLKNFILADADGTMPVGNIKVSNLAIEQKTITAGSKTATVYQFAFNGPINITDGDPLPEIDFWVGPSLGEIPINLVGTLSEDHLYVTIDINLGEDMVVGVELGAIENVLPASNYVESLLVRVNGMDAPKQNANVVVTTNPDGTINFCLRNFILADEEGPMPVGNIAVDNLQLVDNGFSFNESILIKSGSLEGVDMWMGPILGSIPLQLNGSLTEDHMYATININLGEDMVVYVELGSKEALGVEAATAAPSVSEIYTIGGVKVGETVSGINIVKMSDGSVKKVLVK